VKDVRVAMKALAVVWQVRWESASGGLTPSSVRRYRKTIEGWQGPKRNTAWYAWRHFSSSSRAQLAGSRQDGHCQLDPRATKKKKTPTFIRKETKGNWERRCDVRIRIL